MVVVTMHDDDQHIKNMLKYGALGYILKNSKEEILVKAIKTVHNGETFFGEDVSSTLWDMKNVVAKPNSTNILITEREKEILKLLVKSKNDMEISEILAISSRTLLAHKRNLFQKTGSEDVAELSKYAKEHNLIY
jgi:DNA-binding NarL/FixJ family response regulator